jgi:hypothetical protein
MPRQFANILKIIPVSDVSSVTKNSISLKSGKTFDHFLSRNDISPSEKPKRKNENTLYEFEVDVKTEKLSDSMLSKYTPTRHVILQLIDDAGTPIYIGTKEIPVQLVYRPENLNVDTLQFSRQSINPVL